MMAILRILCMGMSSPRLRRVEEKHLRAGVRAHWTGELKLGACLLDMRRSTAHGFITYSRRGQSSTGFLWDWRYKIARKRLRLTSFCGVMFRGEWTHLGTRKGESKSPGLRRTVQARKRVESRVASFQEGDAKQTQSP
jgi:hypothetical protein